MSVLQMINPELLEITEINNLFADVEVVEADAVIRQSVVMELTSGELARIVKEKNRAANEAHHYLVDLAYNYDPARVSMNGVIAVCGAQWTVPEYQAQSSEPIAFAKHAKDADGFKVYTPKSQPELADPKDIFAWFDSFERSKDLLKFTGDYPAIFPDIYHSEGVEELVKEMKSLIEATNA